MKRIVQDVPLWNIMLGREARNVPAVGTVDTPIRQFEDELFDRLYAGADGIEALPADKQDAQRAAWAAKIHAACAASPNFARLASEVRGRVGLAGLAVDQIMAAVAPVIEEEEEERKQQQQQQDATRTPTAKDAAKAAKDLARAVGRGIKGAGQAVEEIKSIEEDLDGLEGPMAGNAAGDHAATDGQRVRKLAAIIRDDASMRRMAGLIGRFRRIAAMKAKQKVKHGADEITDVTQGNDIARLLPSEIMKLRNPALRADFFRSYAERGLLQYELQGTDTKGRGPMVVCLDKSGSMRGENNEWATAVAVALCDIAKADGRTFAVICFDARIIHEVVVGKNEPLPEALLHVQCSGGTDIDVAYARALEIIQSGTGAAEMKKADVVLITDGDSMIIQTAKLREKAKDLGVSTFGIGIGIPKALLEPWCDTVAEVTDVSTLDDKLAASLFG